MTDEIDPAEHVYPEMLEWPWYREKCIIDKRLMEERKASGPDAIKLVPLGSDRPPLSLETFRGNGFGKSIVPGNR